MEMNRLNNFKNHLEQYNENFIITNEDNLITATSTKFIEPSIEEKELELIKMELKELPMLALRHKKKLQMQQGISLLIRV